MEIIKIKIEKDASLSYEVKGVKGARCKDLTKLIDKIAGSVVETKNTGEFCQQETVRSDVNQRR